MTNLITIDKWHYDELVNSREDLKKINDSAPNKIALYYSRHCGMGFHDTKISVLEKDEAIDLMQKELHMLNNRINELQAKISDIRSINVPFLNPLYRSVGDLMMRDGL